MEEEFDEDDELELEGEGGEGEHVHGNDDMGEGSGAMYREVEIREQDRYLPVANIARIMKRLLPVSTKVGKDAKESIQSCVSEFISFITSEASDKCQQEKRKTINGDDLLWAMGSLGFEKYIEPLKIYLAKYRDAARGDKPEKKPYVRREQSNNSSSSKSSSAAASSSNNNPPSSSTTTTSSSNHVHSNVQQPVVSLPQAQPPVAQTNNISNANRNPSPVVSSNSHNLHLAANRPNMNNSLSGHSNVIGSGGHGHSNVSGNSNVIGSGGHGHSNVPGNINYNHLTQVGGLNSMSHPNVIVSHPHVHVNMMQGSGNLHGSNMQGSGNLQGSNMQGSGNLQGSNMQGNLMMHNQLHGNNMNANSAIPSLLNSNVPIGGMGGNLLGRHTIGGNQMMGLSNGGHPHASGSQMLLPGVSKVGSNSSVPLLPGVSTLGSAYNNHLGLNKNSGLLPKTPNTGGMNSMPPRTNMNTSSSVSPVIAPRQALSPQMLSNSPPRTALPNSSGSVNGNVNTIAGATTVVNNSVTTSPVPTNTSVVTNAIPYPNPPPSNPNTSARTASANLEVVQTNTSNAVYVEANTSPDKNKRQKL